MKIDLKELLREVGNQAEIAEEIKLALPQDGLQLTKPVKIDVQLINTGELVILTGTAETEAELECSRCLKKFKTQITANIDEEYCRPGALPPKTGKVIELKEEDFVYPIEKDNTIDLDEIIRQNLILALPIKILCSKNCKGEK